MDGISITGLTARQVDLLNRLWSLQQLADVEAWRATEDPDTQQQIDLLMEMVVLEATDQLLADDITEAAEYLDRFRI